MSLHTEPGLPAKSAPTHHAEGYVMPSTQHSSADTTLLRRDDKLACRREQARIRIARRRLELKQQSPAEQAEAQARARAARARYRDSHRPELRASAVARRVRARRWKTLERRYSQVSHPYAKQERSLHHKSKPESKVDESDSSDSDASGGALRG
ncbi:hypothetical protein C8R43DRAFT_966150 [Mycena crocata]|nr:hypothetical protein C8R43DRAFT_966150 [Mycena crocata]